jgi:hypothetical protein
MGPPASFVGCGNSQITPVWPFCHVWPALFDC